jgi:hypothetical protein
MDAVEQTLEQIDVIHRLVDKYNDVFQFVTTAQGTIGHLHKYLIES